MILRYETEGRNNFPYFEPGQMMLVSLTEIRQTGGGTICGESDAFDFGWVEVIGGLSIWKCIEFS